MNPRILCSSYTLRSVLIKNNQSVTLLSNTSRRTASTTTGNDFKERMRELRAMLSSEGHEVRRSVENSDRRRPQQSGNAVAGGGRKRQSPSSYGRKRRDDAGPSKELLKVDLGFEQVSSAPQGEFIDMVGYKRGASEMFLAREASLRNKKKMPKEEGAESVMDTQKFHGPRTTLPDGRPNPESYPDPTKVIGRRSHGSRKAHEIVSDDFKYTAQEYVVGDYSRFQASALLKDAKTPNEVTDKALEDARRAVATSFNMDAEKRQAVVGQIQKLLSV